MAKTELYHREARPIGKDITNTVSLSKLVEVDNVLMCGSYTGSLGARAVLLPFLRQEIRYI